MTQMDSQLPATHVVVVGGGVVGVTTAAALAQRGLRVTLLECTPQLGSGATAGNGAQLSYCYTDALAAPSLWRDLPRLLTGLDPVFRIHASPTPAFISWALRFLTNGRASRFVENTRAVLRLALLSRRELTALRARYPQLSFKHTQSGKLHIYDVRTRFEAAKRVLELKKEFACRQRVLRRDEALQVEPALGACTHTIEGAIYSPLDEAGDASEFSRALAVICARQYGTTVLTDTAARGFVIERGRVRAVSTSCGCIEGDVFVLAAGCESIALARSAGVTLPIYPMKGYSVTLPATKDSPTVSITDARAKIVFCRLEDQVRIAGMAELGRDDVHIDEHRVQLLLNAARSCLPLAAEWRANPNPWSGLRPMTPDSRPIIGRSGVANLFLNCGHGMLGWTLACGSAELTAAAIGLERSAHDVVSIAEDFALTRFARRPPRPERYEAPKLQLSEREELEP